MTAFSAILGLVELVLAYAADFTMNNGGIDSMLINFSIYWIIAQTLQLASSYTFIKYIEALL